MVIIKVKELNTSSSRKPTSINALKIFFIILQSLSSYDFGFIRYKSTRHKLFIKLCLAIFPVLSGFILIYVLFNYYSYMELCWNLVFIIKNYLFIITLMVTPEKNTFRKFLERLMWIDSEINVKYMPDRLEVKIIISSVAVMICKIILRLAVVNNDLNENIYIKISYFLTEVFLEIPLIMFYFIFVATRIRLVSLYKYANDKHFKANFAQTLYKSLLDSVESVKEAFDPIVSNNKFMIKY